MSCFQEEEEEEATFVLTQYERGIRGEGYFR